MRHLDRFVGTALDRGAAFSSDLPESVLPIIHGVQQQDLTPFTGGVASAEQTPAGV
jgi:hypothetical protein